MREAPRLMRRQRFHVITTRGPPRPPITARGLPPIAALHRLPRRSPHFCEMHGVSESASDLRREGFRIQSRVM